MLRDLCNNMRPFLKQVNVPLAWRIINERYLPVDEFIEQVFEHAVKHPEQAGVRKGKLFHRVKIGFVALGILQRLHIHLRWCVIPYGWKVGHHCWPKIKA